MPEPDLKAGGGYEGGFAPSEVTPPSSTVSAAESAETIKTAKTAVTGITLDQIDETLFNELAGLYATILNESGLNSIDQVLADLGYFSRSGIVRSDPPIAGRTFVFMTRPDLNLAGIQNQYYPYIQGYKNSFLGKYLMSNLMYYEHAKSIMREGTGDFRFNKPTPFVPFVSNLCRDLSGGSDIILETHETDGDLSGNKLSYAAGADEFGTVGEMTMNFDDIYYSPIMHWLIIWVMYMHGVAKGILTPRWEYIVNRIIDYTSSAYVFMLGPDQKKIVRYSKFTGVFPKSVPFGAIQHNREIDMEALKNVQATFQYNFYEAMNPEVLVDFNNISLYYYYRFANPGALKASDPTRYGDIKDLTKVGWFPLHMFEENGMRGKLYTAADVDGIQLGDKSPRPYLRGENYNLFYPCVMDGELLFFLPDGTEVTL